MRCGWGPYFRRTFEVQAGNSPLQGQSKPPAKLVVLIYLEKIKLLSKPVFKNFISNKVQNDVWIAVFMQLFLVAIDKTFFRD